MAIHTTQHNTCNRCHVSESTHVPRFPCLQVWNLVAGSNSASVSVCKDPLDQAVQAVHVELPHDIFSLVQLHLIYSQHLRQLHGVDIYSPKGRALKHCQDKIVKVSGPAGAPCYKVLLKDSPNPLLGSGPPL